MLQEALKKIQAEITAAGDKKPYMPAIGAFVMDRIKDHPEEAVLVTDKSKTLEGALKAMSDAARKVAVNNCGMLTNDQAYQVVLKYFGIKLQGTVTSEQVVVAPAIKTSLDDLF